MLSDRFFVLYKYFHNAYKRFNARACLKNVLKPSNCTKIILLWQIPNILPKGSCLGPLVLKPCFLRLYAPLRDPSKPGGGLPMVKFWNCQSHITCTLFNFQTHPRVCMLSLLWQLRKMCHCILL